MLAERGEGNGGGNDAGSYDQEHSGSRQMRGGDMDESVCCIINIIITIIIYIITIAIIIS